MTAGVESVTTDVQVERERLSQRKFLAWVSQEFQATELLPVYRRTPHSASDIALHCALIPNSKVDEILQCPEWNPRCGDGVPGAMQYWVGGSKTTEYLRYGNDEGIEPLVLRRNFHGIRKPYLEVSEEFRLFHNLYYDGKSDRYLKIDDAGNESEVIVTESDQVRIRLKEIRQFLAVKEMHLSLYFDNGEHSLLSLKELGVHEGGDDIRSGLMVYGVHYGDFRGLSEWKSFSRLLGKRLFPPFSKEKSGFWGFAEEEPKRYVSFIIAVDEHGDEVLSTSDEDQLANSFGANAGKPNYLTQVFFSKAVLDKYYQQPEKYSVHDGCLRCGSLWDMTVDNHHDGYVVAWLGDLGRDLPYGEQLHWRSFNVPPCGKMSQVFFRRQILAEFADTDQPDLKLKYRFSSFCKKCVERLGWSLFLPLATADEHYFDALRIPASDAQKEFDELVQGLAKVLVDSLNEKELLRYVPPDRRSGLTGSISRLECALESQGATDFRPHIKFLRNLYELRSTGSAHRKGSKYQDVAKRFGADVSQLNAVFRSLLLKTLDLIAYLEQILEAGMFAKAIKEGEAHTSDTSDG